MTGDKQSVWLANIAIHHMISKIAGVLKTEELFKGFVDDIIWASFGKYNSKQR